MLLHRAANVLVVQVCLLYARVLANAAGERTEREGAASGEWGEWSTWTGCSAECSTGITVRSRECQHSHLLPVASLLSEENNAVWCSGKDKEIKLCNKQSCQNGKRAWREEECAKYDSSVHSGRRYTWEPFTHRWLVSTLASHSRYTTSSPSQVDSRWMQHQRMIPSRRRGPEMRTICMYVIHLRRDAVYSSSNTSDPCKLTCRAKGYHFYSNLADRVVDGTPCAGASSSPTAVCVQGVCEEVGCDDVVGSTRRRDVCGVCQGDNSTCRTISGVFTREDLNRGLNQIVTIPAESTLINITGMRYSNNWLALHDSNGEYFLNGGPNKQPAGDYEAVGTIFQYKTSQRCTGQCVFAQGPIDQEISLMLNTRGRNHGVTYSFNVPVAVKDDYIQRIIGTTESSVTAEETSLTSDTLPEGGSNAGESSSPVTEDGEVDNSTAVESTTRAEIQPDPESDEYLNSDEDEDEGVYSEESDEDYENDDSVEEGYASNEEGSQKSDEDSIKQSDSTSISIALSKLLSSNKNIEANNRDSESSVDDSDEDDVTEEEDDVEEEEEEEPWVSDSHTDDDDDDDEDDDAIGAPEPLITTPPTESFKIIRKEKPRFIDPEDHSHDSFTGNADESEIDSDSERPPYNDSQDSEEDSDSDRVPPMNSSKSESDQPESPPVVTPHLQTQKETLEVISSKDQQTTTTESALSPANGSAEDTEDTPSSGHSIHPQNDSPTHRQEGSSMIKSRRKFRRPNFSQSFTYRRRHKAKRIRDGPSARRDRPRTTTYGVSPQPSSGRQIRFRPPPTGLNTPRRGIGSLSGYGQPTSDLNPYDRIRSQSSSFSRHGPSHRQALTLGASGSVDKDGTVTLQNGNGRSGLGRDTGLRQYNRQSGSRRRRLESKRKQAAEYARQQEEYRRELQRRRKQMEQQIAAQKAEYQRRLEEHNRRVRQRQLEQQRRQQQHHNSHHKRRRHNRRRHNQHNHGRHQHGRKEPTATGGITGRSDTPNNGVPPQNNGVSRQRTYKPSTEQPSGRTDTKEDITVSQQGVVMNGRRGEATIYASRTSHETTTERRNSADNSEGRTLADRSIAPKPTSPRDTLTKPFEQPVSSTLPTPIANTVTVAGNPVPQYISGDPEYDRRSSFDALSSNQLPSNGDSPLVIGSEGNVVPNIGNGLVIGGGDSLSAVGDENSRKTYEWRVAGLTECTLTCGGGLQQTVVVCLDTRTQAVVTDGNCLHLQRPQTTAVTCNTRPCPAEWQTGTWSSCSVSCGSGEQTRSVTCLARISATLNLTMPDENCQSSARPEDRRACQNGPCNTWQTGNWSDCSVNCGEGIRTRDVYCADQTGYDISDDLCPGTKPRNEEACEMGPCGKGWYYTKWPEQCPAACGTGTKSRRVTCLGDAGYPLPPTSCEKATRPVSQQECKSRLSCGGRWFTGQWGECNVTCGRGYLERDVLCMKSLPGGLLHMVGEENCDAAIKPESEKPCQLGPCSAEWYMTSWTKCSQSCGVGQRTREVKCLDQYQRPSADCLPADKPHSRGACNTQSCVDRPSQVIDADCKDTFSRCEVVKHARMCRYSYYKKQCCLTCSEDT